MCFRSGEISHRRAARALVVRLQKKKIAWGVISVSYGRVWYGMYTVVCNLKWIIIIKVVGPVPRVGSGRGKCRPNERKKKKGAGPNEIMKLKSLERGQQWSRLCT